MHCQQNFALISIGPFDLINYGYVFFSERLSYLEKNQKYPFLKNNPHPKLVIVSPALKAETFCFDWIHICSFWTLAQNNYISFIKCSLNTHSLCNSKQKCYCIWRTTHNNSIWGRVSLTKLIFLAVFWN